MFPSPCLNLRRLAPGLALSMAILLVGCGGSKTPDPPPVTDTTAPTVIITDDTAGVATGPVTFTFTFSERVSSAFTAGQITVTNGTKGTFTWVDNTTCTLSVIPNTGTGTMTVGLAAGAFSDMSGNASLTASETTQDYNYTAPVYTKSTKRGVGCNATHTTADEAALAPGVSWWYNWSPIRNASISSDTDTLNGMNFIPMFWGGTFNASNLESQINALPGVQYLLVVNEPNFTDQAHLSPQACADLWPQIEALATKTGVKIVGPAMGFGPDATYGDPVKWLDAFYAAYKTAHAGQEPHIDALAAHWYDYGLDWYLDKFAKYGKPIWVTEMANWHSDSGWVIDTVAKQKDTMKEMVGICEYRSDVVRYAWFMGRMSPDPHFSSLLGANGVLTEVGQYYLDLPYNTTNTITLPSDAAKAPTDLPANVISLLSGRGTYTSIPVSTWKTSWSAAGADSTAITLGGSSFQKLKFTSGLFVGVEGFETDITGKTTLHIDYWTPEGTSLNVKIVDFGADNAYGGSGANADTTTEITLNAAGTGAWHSADLDFSAQVNKTHIRQLVFSIPATAVTTWYFDNLYFK